MVVMLADACPPYEKKISIGQVVLSDRLFANMQKKRRWGFLLNLHHFDVPVFEAPGNASGDEFVFKASCIG